MENSICFVVFFFESFPKLIQISNVWVFDPVHLVSYGFYWSNCPCILAHQARKIAGYQLQELQVKNRVYYLKWADRDLWDCCSLEQGQGWWCSMIVHDPVHPTFHHIPLPTETTHKTKQKLNQHFNIDKAFHRLVWLDNWWEFIMPARYFPRKGQMAITSCDPFG